MQHGHQGYQYDFFSTNLRKITKFEIHL